jgi:hypothetical protein
VSPLERDTEDLGIVRLCRKCEEEWPVDDEFWFFQVRRGKRHVMGYCKACWSDRDRSKYKGRYYTPRVAA